MDDKTKLTHLRQDKIIYAVEACAISLLCLLAFFVSDRFYSGATLDYISILLLAIAAGYSAYMGIGNFGRLKRIQEIERKKS